MAHIHSVYDTDKHFVIDPVTMEITTESKKLQIMQYDHNSERFTFEIPRAIEGHDMSTCNKVEIHYKNISTLDKTKKNEDFYTVIDMDVDKNDKDIVIFSWLISEAATQLVGDLNFCIHFECASENGSVDYRKNTAIFSKVKISDGINSTEQQLAEHSDFVARMENISSNALEKISRYDETIADLVEAVDSADRYIGEYEYKELVLTINQDDWIVSEDGSLPTYYETDVNMGFIDLSDEESFCIEISFNDENNERFLIQPCDCTFSENNGIKSAFMFKIQLNSDFGIMYGSASNLFGETPNLNGASFILMSDTIPTEMKVYKITKTLGKRIGDILDDINREVI